MFFYIRFFVYFCGKVNEDFAPIISPQGWGYSCLTMIDRETVGILYESSVAHMTFQAVKLTDIVK